MQKSTRGTMLAMALLFASSLVLVSCSSSPSEEELKMLRDLKEETTSLQNDIAKREQEKAALEREVAEKNAKLKKCNDDQQVVKQRLGQ